MSATKRRRISLDGSAVPVTKASSNDLYDRCVVEKGTGEEFSLAELLALDVTDNTDELRDLCQELLDCYCFAPYTRRGATSYRTRSKDLAVKYATKYSSPYNIANKFRLTKIHEDYIIIYTAIEGVDRTGIWKKTLASRTNLHENTITKGLKELIAKNLIKEFKTAKNPTKRMYILFNLEPSEDSTGGNFYREGELDEGLVNALCQFIVGQVEQLSWIEQPICNAVDKSRKRNRSEKAHSVNDLTTGLYKTMKGHTHDPLIPRPSSFKEYPNPTDILKTIENAEFIKDLTLTIEDVRQLIEQLVYDDRLEEISPGRYRSVRRVWTEQFPPITESAGGGLGPVDVDDDGYGPGNGLSYVPCGRCSVSKECRIGGIISPEGCIYMKDWLDSW
jgi:DNA-directed RNA polymerase III subunit RPC6